MRNTTDEVIGAAEAALGIRFPQDYRTFMQQHTGIEADYGGSYLVLYAVEDLAEVNSGYGAGEHAGLVLIGSDGGGEGVAYDFRQPQPPLFLVNFVSIGWDEAVRQAESFTDFMAQRIKGLPYRFES
jgi:hypothetical protein